MKPQPTTFRWVPQEGRWRGRQILCAERGWVSFTWLSPNLAQERTLYGPKGRPLPHSRACRPESEWALRQLDPQQCDAGIYHQRLHHVTGRAL